MLYLGIFETKFEKADAIFEIDILDFVKMQNFMQIEIDSTFWTKSRLFGYFSDRNWKIEFEKY